MDAKPIDFVYNSEKDSYDLTQFASNEDLLKKIQIGITEQVIYRNYKHVIRLD